MCVSDSQAFVEFLTVRFCTRCEMGHEFPGSIFKTVSHKSVVSIGFVDNSRNRAVMIPGPPFPLGVSTNGEVRPYRIAAFLTLMQRRSQNRWFP